VPSRYKFKGRTFFFEAQYLHEFSGKSNMDGKENILLKTY
jgi:hypothetical protein